MLIDPNKPNIRLPHDLVANPYDSKTDIKKLGPIWLVSVEWWITIILMGGSGVLIRYFTLGHL